MSLELAFPLGLAVIAVTIFLTTKYSKRIEISLRILGIGVIITTFVLLLSLPQTGGSVFVSILGALQTSSLDAEYTEWINTAFSKNYFYGALFSVLCVLSPILVGGVILSFFRNEFNKVVYLLLLPFREVCYISELNEQSFILAESLKRANKEHGRKFLIVFCNCGCSDDTLLTKASEEGYIVIADSGLKKISKRKYCQYFFEISHDMDMNLNNTQKLLEQFAKQKINESNAKIFVFTNQVEAEIILNSTDKHGIEVQIINDATAIAYEMVFKHPLYNALCSEEQKNLSILIVGAGRIGKEILKAVTWCGQLGEGYSLEIKVVDKNAAYHRSVFAKECPEIMSGEYYIDFFEADVDTESFESVLDKHCQSCNYITVSLGDDEINIKTAIYLRSYYIRKSKTFDNEPIINVVVASDIKSKCVEELVAVNRENILKKGWDISSVQSQNYNINPFGSYSSVYSYDFLLNSEIEKLSLNGHAVYELAFGSQTITPEDIRYSYFINEINKRSSRANAIHIKYKLFTLGFSMQKHLDTADSDSEGAKALIAKLSDTYYIEKLSRIEHMRWSAFQRCEGYRSATASEANVYKAHTGSHRHLRSKLHVCICKWEELDAISEMFDKDFKRYDENFIRHIPQILGLTQDSLINLSDASYQMKLLAPMYEVSKE